MSRIPFTLLGTLFLLSTTCSSFGQSFKYEISVHRAQNGTETSDYFGPPSSGQIERSGSYPASSNPEYPGGSWHALMNYAAQPGFIHIDGAFDNHLDADAPAVLRVGGRLSIGWTDQIMFKDDSLPIGTPLRVGWRIGIQGAIGGGAASEIFFGGGLLFEVLSNRGSSTFPGSKEIAGTLSLQNGIWSGFGYTIGGSTDAYFVQPSTPQTGSFSGNIAFLGFDTPTTLSGSALINAQFTSLSGYNYQPTTADVSAQVQVITTGFRLNRATGRFVQMVTLTNAGVQSIAGPVSLAFDGLSANATLFSPSGSTSLTAPLGSPFVDVNVGLDSILSPGESVSFNVEFVNSNNLGITYTTRVLAGPGIR